MSDYTEFLVRLGETVRRRRKEKGLSQADLAASVDVEQPTIHRIEKGTQGSESSTLFKLARALDTSIATMMAEAEEVMPTKLPKEAVAFAQMWLRLPADMRSAYFERIEGLSQALAIKTPDEKITMQRPGRPMRGENQMRYHKRALRQKNS